MRNFRHKSITSQSLGADQMHPCTLWEARKEIVDVLAKIFALSFTRGEVLEDWSVANVVPLFKSSKAKSANCRPVSMSLWWEGFWRGLWEMESTSIWIGIGWLEIVSIACRNHVPQIRYRFLRWSPRGLARAGWWMFSIWTLARPLTNSSMAGWPGVLEHVESKVS